MSGSRDIREVWGCGFVLDPADGRYRLATDGELRAHAEARHAAEAGLEREPQSTPWWVEPEPEEGLEFEDEDREIGS